ncbi:MAG: YggT family protein [Clostridia bacterium]|nr:YggT family protein [Clostridia bacterium]
MFFLDFFARLIRILIEAVSLAMMVRMIIPFFKNPEESRLYLFTSLLTEPFIAPVRFLMVKFNLLQDSPIDWSFTITYILLAMVSGMLPIL